MPSVLFHGHTFVVKGIVQDPDLAFHDIHMCQSLVLHCKNKQLLVNNVYKHHCNTFIKFLINTYSQNVHL